MYRVSMSEQFLDSLEIPIISVRSRVDSCWVNRPEQGPWDVLMRFSSESAPNFLLHVVTRNTLLLYDIKIVTGFRF